MVVRCCEGKGKSQSGKTQGRRKRIAQGSTLKGAGRNEVYEWQTVRTVLSGHTARTVRQWPLRKDAEKIARGDYHIILPSVRIIR